MRIATLSNVDPMAHVFTYTLSKPYYYHTLYHPLPHRSPIFEVHTQDECVTVRTNKGSMVVRTSALLSHSEVLADLGYIRAVDLSMVQKLSDTDLSACIDEFEQSGDDLNVFLYELGKRGRY